MTMPEKIRVWVNQHFAARLVDQVTQDLIDVATGNRMGNHFERDALRRIFPDSKADDVTAGNARFVAIMDACKTLGIPTLETRGSDHLDFHSIAVWQLKVALEAAYEAGQRSPE